jgi:hypothetical protein
MELKEGLRATVHRKLGTVTEVGERVKVKFDDGSIADFEPWEIKPLPEVEVVEVIPFTPIVSKPKKKPIFID